MMPRNIVLVPWADATAGGGEPSKETIHTAVTLRTFMDYLTSTHRASSISPGATTGHLG